MGNSPCRRYSLLGIAHPIVGPPFRFRECIGRRIYNEVVIEKKAPTCDLDITFVKCKLYKISVIKFFWTIV